MNAIKKYIVIAIASLMSVSAFADNTDGKLVYVKSFDSSGNNLTNIWVEHISDAFRNVTTDSVSVIIYGNITELSTINITSGKVSIRSAKAGSADASVQNAPPIDSDGYTVTFNSSSTNATWLTAVEGSKLFIGKNFHRYDGNNQIYTESGPLTFNVNYKGRFLENNGQTRIEGPVTIKNGKLSGEDYYGAGIYNLNGLYIDGGVAFLDNVNEKSYGGAIYTKYDTVLGTCTFNGNSATSGSAIYVVKDRNLYSMIRLQNSPKMLTNRDIVYLSEGGYFQKANLINDDACLYVELPASCQTVGHDVAFSHGNADYRNGPIHPEDLDNFHMINLDNTLELVYTEHDADTDRPVLELQKRHVDLTIVKEGMAEGESALFNVKNSTGTEILFHNVSVTAGSGGTGSVTIAGLEVGTYKVEEITNWSWAYDALTGSPLTQDISTNSIFTFKNKAKASAPAHGESNINNSFTGGGR